MTNIFRSSTLIKVTLLFALFVTLTPFASNALTDLNITKGTEASPLASFADSSPSSNITELGDAVHAYSPNGSFNVQNLTVDSNGNSMLVQVNGYALSPLDAGDPNFDYYIFDIYASVTSAAYNSWYVDSAGLGDGHGPSFYLSAFTCYALNQSVDLPYISPAGLINDYSQSQPQTNSLDISLGSFSFGVSHTFEVPTSQTNVVFESTCGVTWGSSANTGTNPRITSYAYDFQLGMKVPKGHPATLAVYLGGNFYRDCGFLCTNYDNSGGLYFTTEFIMPPITTVTSSPAGLGFIYVDGTPQTTPALFVWDEGTSHTLTASPSVSGGAGERYTFVGWNDGGAQSHNIAAPTVTVKTTFAADFQKQYELNVSSSTGGTTDPPVGTYWYNDSEYATVSALPDIGYALHNWVLDGVDVGNSTTISIPMNESRSLTEVFIPVPTITISAGGGGGIVVQSAEIDGGRPQSIPSASSVTYSVPAGTTITLIAKPGAQGYSFLQWSGSQSSQDIAFNVTIETSMDETANF